MEFRILCDGQRVSTIGVPGIAKGGYNTPFNKTMVGVNEDEGLIHRISNRLSAMITIPPIRPKRLSCPLP